MPIRTTRRVGALGRSRSHYLILPLHWCQGSGVEPGSEVEVVADGVLVVVPPGMRKAADRILAAMHVEGP